MKIRRLNEKYSDKYKGKTDWGYELREYQGDEYFIIDVLDEDGWIDRIDEDEIFDWENISGDLNSPKNLEMFIKVKEAFERVNPKGDYVIAKESVYILTDEDIELEKTTKKFNI